MCPKYGYLGTCNWKGNGKVETGRFLGGRGIATVAVGFALYFGVLIFKELPV